MRVDTTIVELTMAEMVEALLMQDHTQWQQDAQQQVGEND